MKKEEDDDDVEYIIKTPVCGESGVGKTCLLKQLHGDGYNPQSTSTIGIDFVKYQRGNIVFQFWDTAGQERFRAVTHTYFRGARLVFFCFDMTRPETLKAIGESWLSEKLSNWDKHLCKEAIGVLVGCKSDLYDPEVQLREQATIFAEEHGLTYIETCAKDNNKCEEAMTAVIERLTRNGRRFLEEKVQKRPVSTSTSKTEAIDLKEVYEDQQDLEDEGYYHKRSTKSSCC